MARAIRIIPSTSAANFVVTYTNATPSVVTAQYNLLAAGLAGTDGVLLGVTPKPGQIVQLCDPAVFDPSGNALSQNITASFTIPEGTASHITDSVSGNVARVGASGNLHVTDGGLYTTAVAAGTTADTVIKASAGRLCKILITTLGTNPLVIYDNATTHSGTIIGYVAASAVAGTLATPQMAAANGITVQGNAANPAFTIGWQ